MAFLGVSDVEDCVLIVKRLSFDVDMQSVGRTSWRYVTLAFRVPSAKMLLCTVS